MKLYFGPLACSLSTRIACYEGAIEVEFVEVDTKAKKTTKGEDYLAVHPLGLVPALRLDDGTVITENAAILQYFAETHASLGMPSDPVQRARLRQWLSFVGAELHKAFIPLLRPDASAEAKALATKHIEQSFDYLNAKVDRGFLLGEFSVADGYLATILNWTRVTPIELSRRPNIAAYFDRVCARPAVQRAMTEELELYKHELARRAS